MKLKVCGMKEPENIRELIMEKPDFIGMIFYEKSPRFIGNDPEILNGIDFRDTQKVGVFVNHTIEQIDTISRDFGLNYIQLHGDESVEFVRKTRQINAKIIKVFRVNETLPIEELRKFSPYVDLFLFDTRSEKYGGSGSSFNWNILEGYDLDTPYLLSGGLTIEKIESLTPDLFPNMAGIDVNSGFEEAPGLKDIRLIKKLKMLI